MTLTHVQDAITTLRGHGQAVSVRAVHRLTGGSFRDITRWLRELAEEVPDTDVEDEEPEPEPVTCLTPLAAAQARQADAEAGHETLQQQWQSAQQQRTQLQERAHQALMGTDVEALAQARTQQHALAELSSVLERQRDAAWTVVIQARDAVQGVYRDATPTARRFQEVRSRIHALENAMHQHHEELTRCEAELPQQQAHLEALSTELRERWGVEEPQ
jgi:chromosome segregation ATPase